MRPVIFDTDIGTDVDDILALVLLAKAPELKLLGVTTVYGDTAFRAHVAKATTHLLGREDIAIVPGEQHTLNGRQIHWPDTRAKGSRRWICSRSKRSSLLGVISAKPQNQRSKRQKTDRLDSQAFLGNLESYLRGNRDAMSIIAVPSPLGIGFRGGDVAQILLLFLFAQGTLGPTRHESHH
jgi:hypothetical protein